MCAESMAHKSDVDLKKWEMKKMLKKLSNYESNNATSMISLFVPKNYDI
jgi:peptide subunit release factor 1 (eRF1)